MLIFFFPLATYYANTVHKASEGHTSILCKYINRGKICQVNLARNKQGSEFLVKSP